MNVFSQTTTIASWHGFQQERFLFEGRNAYIVKPAHPLPGNPWVWNAYFPDWHLEMDSILLSKGFYIAYINCEDMYGNPAAMQVWDKFYQHLINNYSFAQKTVLEGVSRGGLYVYSWAKRNPEKVSCIYGEAPVMDIKSWPGGKGKGRGAPEDWARCLKAFSLTEQGAIDFKDNPIDNIEALAAYKIPIIHVVCARDSIVPLAENTAVFAKKYLSLGGAIQIDTMTQNINPVGHHYDITNPNYYADFIIKYATPVKNNLASATFITLNGKLNNTFNNIKDKKKLTVAFLGGSITYNPGWRDKVVQYLQQAYPQTEFTFIAAGIPSLGSLPHAFRLQSDVLDKGKIDLLFLEAAVNDHANSTDSITQFLAIEGIIRHALKANAAMNIILMAFADNDKNADYKMGIEPLEIKVHRQLAARYQLPFINLSKEVYERIANTEFTWAGDFKNLHPSPYGQNIYFQSIKKMLQLADSGYHNEAVSDFKILEPLNKNCYDNGIYVAVDMATHLKGFSIINKWKPTDNKETREGFVNVPVLEATTAGSSLALSFKGNAVGINIVSGPDAGIIEYSLDDDKHNGKLITLNLFTPWSNALHLPWYLVLADGLQNKDHILKIKVSSAKGNSGGNACRIVHFLVNK